MKLDYNKHYVNKSHTKHYYLGYTFTNNEWKDYTNNKTVQNNIRIAQSSKYRLPTEKCERWYNQDGGKTKIVHPCKNNTFYRSNTGGFFCKFCAREISKFDDNCTFTRIK
jgi:hypothetical protein